MYEFTKKKNMIYFEEEKHNWDAKYLSEIKVFLKVSSTEEMKEKAPWAELSCFSLSYWVYDVYSYNWCQAF